MPAATYHQIALFLLCARTIVTFALQFFYDWGKKASQNMNFQWQDSRASYFSLHFLVLHLCWPQLSCSASCTTSPPTDLWAALPPHLPSCWAMEMPPTHLTWPPASLTFSFRKGPNYLSTALCSHCILRRVTRSQGVSEVPLRARDSDLVPPVKNKHRTKN